MSLRSAGLVLALFLGLGAGCGGGGGGGGKSSGPSSGKEPTNAREKQLQEAKASGELDEGGGQTSWGKWRYTGDRNNCYFAVGRKCFKTEVAACQALRCKGGQKCKSSGAGPATVACEK